MDEKKRNLKELMLGAPRSPRSAHSKTSSPMVLTTPIKRSRRS